MITSQALQDKNAGVVQLYYFDQLKKDIQQKVIEDNRDLNVTDNNWSECVQDDFKETHQTYFSNVEISYDISCCQGDGASFECDVYIVPWAAARGSDEAKQNLRVLQYYLKKYGDKGDDIYASFYRDKGCRYVHENSCNVSLDTDLDLNELTSGGCDDYNKNLSELEDHLNNDRISLCKKLYKDLQNDYEDLTSDEAIKESLICNEYTYLEDGTMYI